jgi:hypothetical protein
MRPFLSLFALLGLLATPSLAGEVTPLLVANGEAKMACDGQMRFMYTTPIIGQQVVGTYLFGNLVTHPNYGADVVLWSPDYGTRHPQAKWGPLGDLHIFSRPDGHAGGRQGERERWFQPDGVTINSYVQVAAVCWGGGTLEIYAVVWVRALPAG